MRVIRYVNCPEVEQEHRQNERQYAHTFHYEGVVCLCDAFWRLPRPYRDGILLHEIGHLLVGPEGSEQEATEAAEQVFGVDIVYVDSDYGEALERVMNPSSMRELLKRKLLVAARKEKPKDFDRFKQNSYGTMDDLGPEFQAELDRLEQHRIGHGIGRLLNEVWNEYQRELVEEETFRRWKV